MVVAEEGLLTLGTMRTSQRKIALVLVAPQVQPPVSFKPITDVSCVLYIILDGTYSQHHADPLHIPATKIFKDDFMSLTGAAIGTALAAVPSVQLESPYVKYTGESRTGTPISIEDYCRAITPSEISNYDLVVDAAGMRAWRSGEQITQMAQTKDHGRHDRISKKGLQLLAAYMRRPNIPLSPYTTGPYKGRDDSRVKKTPQVMLLNMRKTLRLENIWVQTGNPSGESGDGLYSFNTTDFTYLLIAPPDNS